MAHPDRPAAPESPEALAESPQDVRIWVWRGPRVLRNRGPGVVALAARTEADAWARLRREDPGAWFHLNFARTTFWTDDLDFAVSMLDEDDLREAREAGFPLRPEGHLPGDMPALVAWGPD